jgi:hypothetical protein
MEYDIIVYDKVKVISKYNILNKNDQKSIININFIIIQIKWARTDQRQVLLPLMPDGKWFATERYNGLSISV